jgi:signal transduction histidine kinase
VVVARPGEIDIATPIPRIGTMVGFIDLRSRDLFGESLRKTLGKSGTAALVTSDGQVLESAGAPAAEGANRSWLVTQEHVLENVSLRVVQAADELGAELDPAFDRMLAISALAFFLAIAAGGVLALVLARLEAARDELSASRSLAAMGVTAAAIAHEVKNSLNGLSVSMDLLASGAPPETTRQVHVQGREEIARLRRVADDLTLFASRPALQLAPADVNDLCRRAVAFVRDQGEDAGVEISVELCRDGAPLPLPVDAQKLLGVLQNLARNAVEAMGPGAYGEKLGEPAPHRTRRLTISTAELPDAVEVMIADTGAGIDRGVRDRIFEPFVTTKRTGTGLGLAIAKRVVEAHGGRIEAEDRPEGGTLIRLRIPGQPALAVAEPGRTAAAG